MKKLALVHDHLCSIGGSERIFQYFCEEFPDADIYTLACNKKKTLPFFSDKQVNTTWLNPLIRSAESFRWAFPIACMVMKRLDLSMYDLVLSSSATTAKYVKTAPGKHLCYCYIPTRALWHTEQFFGKSWKKYCLKPFLEKLKRSDYTAAQQVDHFIAISADSKSYIKKYYHRDSSVLHCPIETDKFTLSKTKQDHYLLVSRLEPWKKVGYAIDAFNHLGRKLKVIGSGSEEALLRKKAKNNIEFLGSVDDAALVREYREAKAVIFTPFLEYGLIPLEANACGTPVICYGKGGVLETMVSQTSSNPTAVFFENQTAESLERAVKVFEEMQFDPEQLSLHAAQWNVASFKKKIREKVESYRFS